MRAMVFDGSHPRLDMKVLPERMPAAGELLINVHACGVCRTDLHVLDGELSDPNRLARPVRPVILGHEIVGTVAALGAQVSGFEVGDRVGVPWLGRTCGICPYCLSCRENLCDSPDFTGYTIDGGYAEQALARSDYCLHLPINYDDARAAPLLCAGLIGYRTLMMAAHAQRIGIYGFGAAAHIVAQVARHQGRTVFAFTRPGDTAAQQFARKLGAQWAGGSDERAPEPLDAALIFAPVGALVPIALKAVVKGGKVVCGGIHMSDIPTFPYASLWGERQVLSVANLTRADGQAFMKLAGEMQLHIEVTRYALSEANLALDDLRHGRVTGAAVLMVREAAASVPLP